MNDSSSRSRLLVSQNEPTLRALLDAIVPGDETPSASAAGGLDFLASTLGEKPAWIARVESVLERVRTAASARYGREFEDLGDRDRADLLDELADVQDHRWFAQLVSAGYYADAGNGGNRDERSWLALGWTRAPHGGWPPRSDDRVPSAVVGPEALSGRYDAIVVGSGAGGGVAACGLAESGRTVLVVEAGSWPSTEELAVDHLRNPRSTWGFPSLSGPEPHGSPRTIEEGGGTVEVDPTELAWSNNAVTVGGGTRVYGAQAWRFGPADFEMATRYGVPEGSALADWPFGYDELEPYYSRIEWEVGVSGGAHDGAHAGHRGRPLPMPPVPGGRVADVLARGAETLGLSTLPVPLLINSTPWLGRPGCARCTMCVGFACPVDAKNGSHNTMLDRAFRTGRCSILLETRVERLVTDAAGRVTGVAVVGVKDGRIWRAQIPAREVVVAAGAIESARLLLNSATDREPNGIGNDADQVGRYLQAHLARGPLGVFDDIVADVDGPGPSIATGDFRHGNPGVIGGGILVNEFTMTPSNAYRTLSDGGVIPVHGLGAKRGLRELHRRVIKMYAPIQEMTSAESRVRLDPVVKDRFGIPVARLSAELHPEDIRVRDFLAERAEEWLLAAGAGTVVRAPGGARPWMSRGQHQAGTCRMGTDPSTSVTDPWGRVWGHDNLRVADGSLHVTNGGVNPVLTIFANALRVVDHMTA